MKSQKALSMPINDFKEEKQHNARSQRNLNKPMHKADRYIVVVGVKG